MTPLLHWIRNHDESWLFVGIYIGFAVVLSVMLSLFWLVVMVAIHFVLEVIRHRRSHDGWLPLLSQATWEIRLDIALVLLAFAVSLYMDAVMGIVGLQSAGRAAVATQAASRVGTRAVAWQRMIRAIVLGFDDVANGIRAIFMRKKGTEGLPVGAAAASEGVGGMQDGPHAAATRSALELPTASADSSQPDPDGESPVPEAASPAHLPGWGQKWSVWDHLTMALKAACLVGMLAAPGLTGSTYADAVQTLRDELRPFPAAEENVLGTTVADEEEG